MTARFADHFSGHAAGYAAHRPTYPAALVDYLAGLAPARDCAWDAGCGSGQLSALLAEAFARVVATDASAEQVARAKPHPAITYRCAPAEASGLDDGSVDLAVAAQAAHWFDLDGYYREVRRVCRPGAAVALVTYGILEVAPAVDAVIAPFYHGVIGPHWPPERRHVEDGYRSLPFPFEEIGAPPLAIAVSWRLPDLLGYIDTWSAVRRCEAVHGRAPIEAFANDLAAVWAAAWAAAWDDPDRPRTVRFPLSLRVGRVAG